MTPTRRLGPKPQQHCTPAVVVAAGRVRPTKAGAEAPATRTMQAVGPIAVRRPTLNEGRGRSPSNTIGTLRHRSRAERRSTKAGAEAPATRERRALAVARSTKAGAEAPATLPLTSRARNHAASASLNEGRGRSPSNTAGGATCIVPADRETLNEGRGRSPSNTASVLWRDGQRGLRSTKAGAEAPATLVRFPK